jgi:amidase
MTFTVPSTDQVRKLGEDLGMELTAEYANSVINFITPFSASYRELEALADEVPPVKYPRVAYYRPEGDENKYNAWLVKTSIKGAESGKLAGKKVAIKDTYCIAGLPLTNGASVLEGLVPEFDASVVTRLLDAGAEIVGKSVCEYFSFSGGQGP